MLETIWFLLWGLIWGIYFMLDGFDFGLGILLPFITRSDKEKRLIYNAMGPFWDGNEVWLVIAGGVTFAAFPATYAVMFSTLYTPLLMILFALIIRAVSFEFRNKITSQSWKSFWDACLFIGSFTPALLFGVAFANIFKGIPFDKNYMFQGNLLTLLNPYGLLGGLLFLALSLEHGAIWLAIKSDGNLQKKAKSLASGLWIFLLFVAVGFLGYTWFATSLYDNYLNNPFLFILPFITVLALLSTRVLIFKNAFWKAWAASCVTILTTILFGFVGLFPNMYPSSVDPVLNLTAFNASSTPLTLKIMLGVALVMVPIIIAYQTWAYYLFSGKIDEAMLSSKESY